MPPKTASRQRELKPLAHKLYQACVTASTAAPYSSASPKSDFTDTELLALNVVSNMESLLPLAQELTDASLLQLLQNHTTSILTYRLRGEETASSISSLDTQTQHIYKAIEAAGTNGAWTKTLRIKSGLHQNDLTRCLRTLEGRGMIKQTRNVRYPTRKLFMLSALEPTDEATGGPWFSDGELDLELVEKVSSLVVLFVESRSWKVGRKVVWEKKRLEKVWVDDGVEGGGGGTSAANAGKRLVEREKTEFTFAEGFEPEAGGLMPGAGTRSGRLLIPFAANYDRYPTADDVLTFIDANAVVEGKDVRVDDVRMLLEVLEYDGKVEKVGERRVLKDEDDEDDQDDDEDMKDGYTREPGSDSKYRMEPLYRSVRIPYGQDPELGNGSSLADTPCARCPVFRLCEDGGPVDARSCGYFEGWLSGSKGVI